MSDKTIPVVPSLSSDEEVTPPARPPMNRQRRAAAQRPPEETATRLPAPSVTVVVPPSDQVKITIEPAGLPRYARWKVLEDAEVPRGASTFELRREQVLSEQHYDVGALIAAGVKLERLPE